MSDLLPARPDEPDQSKMLVALDRIRAEIEQCQSIADITQLKEIRTQAEAYRNYFKTATETKPLADECAAIRLRAERQAGGILRTTELNQGRPKRLHDATVLPTLNDLGLDKYQSHRWQKIDLVPTGIFEDYLAAARADPNEDISAIGLIMYMARQRDPGEVTDPIPPKPGSYRCIVIDPPWPMKKIENIANAGQGITLDYPVMELDQIADESLVPVRTHAADDGCHIYLWVTHHFMPAGLELMQAWGFSYQCVMTWRKNVGFTPFSWMYDTEHILFGTRGNLPLLQNGLRLSFEAPRTGHSIKPDIFYERVTAASPGPRIDMFARTEREGFDVWGNEVNDAVI